MRTQNLNKRPIWHLEYIGEDEILDNNGFPTGEFEKKYNKNLIKLNLYTGTSEIIEEMFGTTNNIDIVCSATGVNLNKGDKLFYNEPTENDYDDFDLEVTAKFQSLNHIDYGFRGVK